ncbi:MAG: YesL family protein [Clostridia bacterium]|nr:YesL family protein [Clostridia bacterium]
MSFFGNMMNNYFYGKAGQGDYTVESMPQNRRQLFGEVFKVRWSSLFGVNLLYMISWIPAILWIFLNISMLYGMFGADGTMPTAADMQNLLLSFLVILFPCIAITGPFKAGMAYVLRNWARDEHSFVVSDFFEAVKNNWKQALGVSIIDGFMPLLLYVCWYYYGNMISTSFFFMLPLGIVFLVAVVWYLAHSFLHPMMVTYDLKFKDLIRNAVLLSLAKLPQIFGLKLLTLAAPVLAVGLALLIPSIEIYALLILALLYIFYLPAFNNFIHAATANWLCETFLNPNIEGAQTDIGLRPENWDDVEYLPEDDE